MNFKAISNACKVTGSKLEFVARDLWLIKLGKLETLIKNFPCGTGMTWKVARYYDVQRLVHYNGPETSFWRRSPIFGCEMAWWLPPEVFQPVGAEHLLLEFYPYWNDKGHGRLDIRVRSCKALLQLQDFTLWEKHGYVSDSTAVSMYYDVVRDFSLPPTPGRKKESAWLPLFDRLQDLCYQDPEKYYFL